MSIEFIIGSVLLFFTASLFYKKINNKVQLIYGLVSLVFFIVYAFIDARFKFACMFFALISISLIIKNISAFKGLAIFKNK